MYVCDDGEAVPNSTDHTPSLPDHLIQKYGDKWVQHLTLFSDNVRIHKNQ